MTAPPTKAIIIAAGRGKRLMPYTDEMPKCMVPVAGRPMLGHQLAAFRAHGVQEVVIIRGYLGQVLEARQPEIEQDGMRIRYVWNREFETNNVLQSLFCAEAELAGPVLLTYSDIIFTEDVVGALMQAPGDAALVIDRDFAQIYQGRTEHPLCEAEVADLDEAGNVRSVGKRSLPADEAWGEFIGLMKLSSRGTAALREAWAALTETYKDRDHEPFQRAAAFRVAYLTDMLQHLIDGGMPMTPVGIRGAWREIDTVQDLQRADDLLGSQAEDWK